MINKLVLENLKHRWIRTVLSAIVIGVQVTTILTLVGLSQGMLEDSARRARGVGAEVWLRPESAGAFTMSSAQIDHKFVGFVAKQPHVKMALGVVIVQVVGLTTMAGVDYNKFVELSGDIKFAAGGPPQQPDDLIVDEFYERQNAVKVGQSISF